MRATAASAPSKTMFSVSCTLRLAGAVVEHVRQHAGAIAVPDDQHVRRGRARRKVHDVRHLAGFLVAADDPDRLGRDRFLRLVGRRADVVRAVDVRQRRSARPESRRSADAGSLANTSRPTRSFLSRTAAASAGVVHDLAARGVDEHRARLQSAEHVGVHQSLRVRRRARGAR